MSLQDKPQAASKEFQTLQMQTATTISARQRLDAQLSENELVKKEFARLTPENTIFKQIGPVLIKQDQSEAQSNVDTRIEFIRGEIKRIEGQLKEFQIQADVKKKEIIEIQTSIQQENV